MERQHYRATALLATALLVGSGAGYRVLASRIMDLFAVPPLVPGTLARLPVQIGDWTGEVKPLDEWTIEWIHADDHVSRVYTRGGTKMVSVFIALRRRDIAYGVPASELMPHRPENCYPRVGWAPGETHTAGLETGDGTSLPVKILRFHRGQLEVERVTVLVYYIVDGQRGHSPSQLRSSGWRPKRDVRYVAQVQITCSGNVLGPLAEEVVRAFAVDSAPDILALITDAVGRSDSLQKNSTDGASPNAEAGE